MIHDSASIPDSLNSTPPDTPLIWTLSMAPSVSVLTGFEPPGHPINMDTFYGPLSVRVNGV